MLHDLLGREYIDCLGGYGIFSAGVNHPDHRQGGHRPARAHGAQQPGAAGAVARRAGPGAGRGDAGRAAELVLHQQRHRRDRGRDQAGPALHQTPHLHLHARRLPRQVDGLALAHGEGVVPGAVPERAAGRALRALRRRRRAGGRAAPLRRGGSAHRRRGAGAGAGRGRRRGPPDDYLPARPGGVHQVRRAADRRRDPDRHGPHRQALGRGPLGGGARHHVPGQVASAAG